MFVKLEGVEKCRRCGKHCQFKSCKRPSAMSGIERKSSSEIEFERLCEQKRLELEKGCCDSIICWKSAGF